MVHDMEGFLLDVKETAAETGNSGSGSGSTSSSVTVDSSVKSFKAARNTIVGNPETPLVFPQQLAKNKEFFSSRDNAKVRPAIHDCDTNVTLDVGTTKMEFMRGRCFISWRVAFMEDGSPRKLEVPRSANSEEEDQTIQMLARMRLREASQMNAMDPSGSLPDSTTSSGPALPPAVQEATTTASPVPPTVPLTTQQHRQPAPPPVVAPCESRIATDFVTVVNSTR